MNIVPESVPAFSFQTFAAGKAGALPALPYVIGDLLTANSVNTLARLPAVATGVLGANGVGVLPAWTDSPVLAGTGQIAFQFRAAVRSPVNGQISAVDSGGANGVVFDFTVDGLLAIRDRTGTSDRDIRVRSYFTSAAAFLARSTIAWTNGAAAAAGTLNNAPAAGNPTKWIPVDDNGTTRFIPAW